MTKNNETSQLVNNSNQIATPNTRKRVTTRAKSAQIQTPTSQVAKPIEKHTFRVSLNCISPKIIGGDIHTIGIYHTDLYLATSKHEAIGLAVSTITKNYPRFHVDLQNVHCAQLLK